MEILQGKDNISLSLFINDSVGGVSVMSHEAQLQILDMYVFTCLEIFFFLEISV